MEFYEIFYSALVIITKLIFVVIAGLITGSILTYKLGAKPTFLFTLAGIIVWIILPIIPLAFSTYANLDVTCYVFGVIFFGVYMCFIAITNQPVFMVTPVTDDPDYLRILYENKKVSSLSIRILNSTGQIILDKDIIPSGGSYKETLSLAGQAIGIYTIEISSDIETVARKVEKS